MNLGKANRKRKICFWRLTWWCWQPDVAHGKAWILLLPWNASAALTSDLPSGTDTQHTYSTVQCDRSDVFLKHSSMHLLKCAVCNQNTLQPTMQCTQSTSSVTNNLKCYQLCFFFFLPFIGGFYYKCKTTTHAFDLSCYLQCKWSCSMQLWFIFDTRLHTWN